MLFTSSKYKDCVFPLVITETMMTCLVLVTISVVTILRDSTKKTKQRWHNRNSTELFGSDDFRYFNIAGTVLNSGMHLKN